MNKLIASAVILFNFSAAYSQFGGSVKINVGGGNSVEVGTDGVNVNAGGVGVKIGPNSTEAKIGNTSVIIANNGQEITIPGYGTINQDTGKIHIPDVGEAIFDKINAKFIVPGVGEIRADGIYDRNGKRVIRKAYDGTFVPNNWSDSDIIAFRNPTARNIQQSFSSNKADVLAALKSQWVHVFELKEVDWEEYQKMVKAVAASVAVGNPAPAAAYVKQYINACIVSLKRQANQKFRELGNVENIEMILIENLFHAFNKGTPNRFDFLECQLSIGVLTIHHQKKLSADFPIGGQFTNRFWSVDGPNTFLPYIAIRTSAVRQNQIPIVPRPQVNDIKYPQERIALGASTVKGQIGMKIAGIKDGTYAKHCGLLVGDEILSINGIATHSALSLSDAIDDGGARLSLIVKRNGINITIIVQPAHANLRWKFAV